MAKEIIELWRFFYGVAWLAFTTFMIIVGSLVVLSPFGIAWGIYKIRYWLKEKKNEKRNGDSRGFDRVSGGVRKQDAN